MRSGPRRSGLRRLVSGKRAHAGGCGAQRGVANRPTRRLRAHGFDGNGSGVRRSVATRRRDALRHQFQKAGMRRRDSRRSLLPAGPRTAVFSTAGGWAIQTAEAIERSELELALLPDDLREAAIDKHIPPRWSRHNPIDLAGGETRDTIPELMDADRCPPRDRCHRLPRPRNPIEPGRPRRRLAPSTPTMGSSASWLTTNAKTPVSQPRPTTPRTRHDKPIPQLPQNSRSRTRRTRDRPRCSSHRPNVLLPRATRP